MQIVPGSPEGYFATAGGFFKSSDGQNWSESIQGMSGYFGTSVAVDPSNPQTVFLTTTNGGGIFKSTNGGNSWTQTYYGGDGEAIAVDPFNSSHVIATADSVGLMESQDGGVTWVQVTSLPAPPSGTLDIITAIAFHPSLQGVIFISVEGNGGVGLLRSTDHGATYQLANSGLQNDSSRVPVIVSPSDPNTLLLGMDSGVYTSTNLGSSWQKLPLSAGEVLALAIDAKAKPAALYASTINFSPQCCTYGLYKSSDLGNSWSQLNVTGTVVVDPSSANSLFLMTEFQVSWSPDGGQTWIPMSQGLGSHSLLGYSGWDRSYAVAGTSPHVFYSTSANRGIWQYITGP
jgi:photosystem II stability/assembly factor-like uncharacterized protein